MKKLLFGGLIPIILTVFFLTGCNNDDTINIKVNQMECFSGKTKQEIFDIRKKYVAKSIFKSENYEPSEEVFGHIEDGLPWKNIFTEICNADLKKIETKGWSEESRFINNPTLLIGLNSKKSISNVFARCDGTTVYFMPQKILYIPNEKLIKVYYNDLHLFGSKYPIYLDTLNAKDLGFKYIKMEENKSVHFVNKDNVSNKFFKLKNKITKYNKDNIIVCNDDIYAYSNQLEFFTDLSINNLETRVLHFKLWKSNPEKENIMPDMYYQIEIQTSANDKKSFDSIMVKSWNKGIRNKILNGIRPNVYKNLKINEY